MQLKRGVSWRERLRAYPGVRACLWCGALCATRTTQTLRCCRSVIW